MEINEECLVSERFGAINYLEIEELEDVSLEELEELEEKAKRIDYSQSTEGIPEKIMQRVWGGAIETPEGRKDWAGRTPEDVKEYLQEVRESIR